MNVFKKLDEWLFQWVINRELGRCEKLMNIDFEMNLSSRIDCLLFLRNGGH